MKDRTVRWDEVARELEEKGFIETSFDEAGNEVVKLTAHGKHYAESILGRKEDRDKSYYTPTA